MRQHPELMIAAGIAKTIEEEKRRKEYEEKLKDAPVLTQKQFHEWLKESKELQDKHNPYQEGHVKWGWYYGDLVRTPEKFPEYIKDLKKLKDKYGLPDDLGPVRIIREGDKSCQPND